MLQGLAEIGFRAEAMPLRFAVAPEPGELALGIAARFLLDARAGVSFGITSVFVTPQ